jgi:hypothetical protein
MSREEIDSTYAVRTTARSERTATVLDSIINYLAANADKCDNLVEEVRTKFESETDITIEKVKGLPYLNAVINEGLRLCPPVPWILPRLVPAGGDTMCGTWLPGGVCTSVQKGFLPYLTLTPKLISGGLEFRFKHTHYTAISSQLHLSYPSGRFPRNIRTQVRHSTATSARQFKPLA